MDYFSEVIGHEAAKEVLARAVLSPRHGYLITGPTGVGCHLIAEAFVRALTTHPADRPLAAHPDIIVLARDWNEAGTAMKKEIAVKDVRALRMRIAERPSVATRVVAYLPDADALNEEGVNALLKSIEEPPAGAVFVLVAHRPGRLPATLLSRLQSLALRRVASPDIDAWLKQKGVEATLRNESILASDGRPGIALRYAEDDGFRSRISDADRVIGLLIAARTPGDVIAAIAPEASLCDGSDDAVTEWRETLHLWGVALRRRMGVDASVRLTGIGHAFLQAERHLGGPISPRLILELGLNYVVSGAAPVFPGWKAGAYPFPIGAEKGI